MKLAEHLPPVPNFDRSSLQELQCIPCLKRKTQRAPISSNGFISNHTLHLVHIDIARPVATSIADNRQKLSILDEYTAKSDVFLLKTRTKLI